TGAMALAFLLSLIGFVNYLPELDRPHGHQAESTTHGAGAAADHDERWQGHLTWATLGMKVAGNRATELQLRYRVDSLTVVMFLMVTLVGTLIHVFSIGYMSEELQPIVEDHQVHTDHGHLRRRGRFGRFFLFMSLFCFSMLNLVLADNLFQIFISW